MSAEITGLLHAMQQGDREALERVLPLIYDELSRIARRHLARERRDHTLNTGALVHEAYLKLVDQPRADWRDRGHFFAVASLAMRRILVNHARDRRRAKRGGGAVIVPLNDEHGVISGGNPEELLIIDELLSRLAEADERAARVVECRFFGGLTIEETSEALGIAPTTVKRAWRHGKAWLRREMLGPERSTS